MAQKTTTTGKRKRRRKAPPKPKLLKARNPDPGMPMKRTSMWLGADLLQASAAEAKRLGVSRALWVQVTLRAALKMPVMPVASGAPSTDSTSVFG